MKVLAPAGNIDCLKTAIYHGADEIYLGINDFNARNNIDGFTLATLKEAVDFAHVYGVKVFLAVNILFTDKELQDALNTVICAYNTGVDAFIVQDLGLIKILYENYPEIELHCSTQTGIHNLEGVKELEKYGIKRVVLARETPLSEIKRIHDNSNVELEYFVQGALCVSFSGNCYLSSRLFNASGNRGRCKQLCRLPYKLLFNGKQIKSGYLLSAKDFNMIRRLKDLQSAGVTSLKIEGRARRPYYVATATEEYVKAVKGEQYSLDNLELAFNRNYTEGYFNGNSGIISNVQNHVGVFAGVVEKVVAGKKFNQVFINPTREISLRSTLKFYDGEKEFCTITAYDIKEQSGKYVVTTTNTLKAGLKVRLISDYQKEQAVKLKTLKRKTDIELSFKIGQPLTANVTLNGKTFTVYGDVLERANKTALSQEEVTECFCKTAVFEPRITFSGFEQVFAVKSKLNAFRRGVYLKAQEFLTKLDRKELKPVTVKELNKSEEFKDYRFVADETVNCVEKNVVYSPESYDLKRVSLFVSNCALKGKTPYLDTPNFALKSDVEKLKEIVTETNVGVVANNYYALSLSNNTVIGAGLNVYNNTTAVALNKPFIPAEKFDSGKYAFPYMTLRHCPIKEHVGGDCNNCKYKDGYEYLLDGNRKFKLKRKKLSTCTFYLTD